MNETIYDIIIIGAGASGLMAASVAVSRSSRVLILEKMKQPGKKLLATGNGRCNLANEVLEMSCYHSSEHALAEEILSQISLSEILDHFAQLGILTVSHNGYLYPHSEQAKSVLHALLSEVTEKGAKLKLNTCVKEIVPLAEGFRVEVDGYAYFGKCVILAAGGLAAPVFGSDGDGISFAQKLGHQMAPTSPALTGILCEEKDFFAKTAGVRVSTQLRLRGDAQVVEERGEVQFTSYGLSGIPAMILSRHVGMAALHGESCLIEADFLPDLNAVALCEFLSSQKDLHPKKTWEEILSGLLPEKLANALVHGCAKQDAETLTKGIKSAIFHTFGVRGYEDAQVTAGGILLHEVDPKTMESKIVPNLYLTGELLDVDGICGGYNLQWAWTTGMLAGRAAAGQKEAFHL
ncbi:MAG: aminoacetone oxidase family FAD-binding enzyme [Lachnospiraceae bacterium]|nr:aminoacetone oxidase family FAD-binding enzyme [Lachnospiraceae bacterium]